MGGWRVRVVGCGVIIMFTFTKLITGFSVGSVCGPGLGNEIEISAQILVNKARQGSGSS